MTEHDGGCCESLRRKCGMDALLKALGLNSKQDYAERIPETLTPEHFDLHETFFHGFPSQPTCLAYDSVQQLLAIGTENGGVVLLGMPGLERRFSHPLEVPILQMLFITNKGLLVTCCDNKTLYLWSLRGKMPFLNHQLEFSKEKPTALSWPFDSKWMYVGTDNGNIHMVHVDNFAISGYCIYWNDAIDRHQRVKPGDVIAVQEDPMDQGKIVIAYSTGLCVLWNLKNKYADRRFAHYPKDNHILTCMCWHGDGKGFSCSYSDGSVVHWNRKYETKPEKIFFPHESGSNSFKPIYKMQVMYTDGDPWYVCIGGFPEETSSAPRTLTVHHGKSTRLLSTTSTILDVLNLPSSPYPYDYQKPFALVILTKDELIVHDLQNSGFPTFNLPYALDVHLSPVTCVQYYGNCPEEFIASLHSTKSKLMAGNKTAKPWPLVGGKWGEEAPQSSTDIIVTGHIDGSIRLWYCSSVIFQPLFTVSTSRYFKMKYAFVIPSMDAPVIDQPPVQRFVPFRGPDLPVVEEKPEDEEMQKPDEKAEDSPSSPETLDIPSVSEPHPIERKGKKSFFKKKVSVPKFSKTTTSSSKDQERGTAKLSPGHEGKGDKSTKLSFRKMTNLVKASQKLSGGASKNVEAAEPTSPPTADKTAQHGVPQHQHLKSEQGPDSPGIILSSPMRPATLETDEASPKSKSSKSQSLGPKSPGSTNPPTEFDDDFFAIQEINMCVHGLWMCVANIGGSVLTFHFRMGEVTTVPKSLDICISDDRYVKPGASGSTSSPPPSAAQRPPASWVLQEGLKDTLPGFQLIQHCHCYCSNIDDGESGLLTVSSMQYSMPLGMLAIGTDQGFTVVDTITNRCLYTLCNLTSMLYMADNSKYITQLRRETSRTSFKSTSPKATVTRHATSWALSKKAMDAAASHESPPLRSKPSQVLIPGTPLDRGLFVLGQAIPNGDPALPLGTVEVSDFSVTALEIVHLQLDKQTPSTVTLWVGLASGHIAVYGVNTRQPETAATPREIELIPTRYVSEHKNPIVSIHFLNEWGDLQLVPYKAQTLDGVKKIHKPSEAAQSQKPLHYVVITDSKKIRVSFINLSYDKKQPLHRESEKTFSFPGGLPVGKGLAIPDTSVWLRSEYFRCNDLPCILSVTQCLHIVVHSLPGLKPLMDVTSPYLKDAGVLLSFRVSGNGQALCMSSASEIQRISVVKDDRLNLPGCLPDVYVPMKDPQPCGGKGFIGALFGGGPSEMNKEEIFGEKAGRPLSSLAKRDGKSGMIDITRQRQRTRQGRAGGVGSQMAKNVKALDKRQEDLSKLEKCTEDMTDRASDFATYAEKLAQKHKH